MQDVHEILAERLREAYSGQAVPPLRDLLDPRDAESAYAVQDANTRFWVNAGRQIVGRKIGLTARAVQQQLGVDQPDYGSLFADMAIADGGELFASRALQPKAEAEVALIMARDLNDAEITPGGMVATIDHAVAGIEIVDSRIENWKITFADTVADNGSSGFFVLGSDRRKLAGLDLYTCGMALEIDGAVAAVGAGAACLGHPLNAAAWLARALARLGIGLKAGDVLLTGALGPMAVIQPGNHVRASIGGVGTVSFSYVKDR